MQLNNGKTLCKQKCSQSCKSISCKTHTHKTTERERESNESQNEKCACILSIPLRPGANISKTKFWVDRCFVINLFLVLLTSTFNTHYTWVNKQPAQSSYSNYVDSFFFFSLSFSFICFSFLCGALLLSSSSSSSLSTSFWCVFFYLCIGLWLIFYEQNRLCAMRTRWREFRRKVFFCCGWERRRRTEILLSLFLMFSEEKRRTMEMDQKISGTFTLNSWKFSPK